MSFSKRLQQIKKDSILQEILTGSAWSLALKSIGSIAAFVVVTLVTRNLGAEEAGDYFFLVSIVALLMVVLRLGLDQAVLRLVANAFANNNWVDINRLHSNSFVVVFFTSLFGVVAIYYGDKWFVGYFAQRGLQDPWLYLIWATLPFALGTLQGAFYQGIKSMPGFVAANGLGLPLIMLALLGITYLFGLPLSVSVMAGYYLLASCILVLLLLIGWYINPLATVDSNSILSFPSYFSTYLWASQCVFLVFSSIAPVLLGVLATSADVSIFFVALRTVMISSLFIGAINSIAAPKFSEYFYNQQRDMLFQTLKWSLLLSAAISLPFSLLMIIFADEIMLIFGQDFNGRGEVLVILAIGQMVNVLTATLAYMLTMANFTKDLFIINIIAMLVILLLSAILIPNYGAIGGAIAYAVAITLQSISTVYYVMRRFAMNTV